jgi:antitoxin (DNA-binding transcriptional repressor) of toxin-antitoxin stability system
MKKRVAVTDFREQCLQLFDNIPADGIVITKRGKPIAKVVRVVSSCSELIGSVPNLVASGDDDLFSTGIAWDAESRHAHID